MCTADNAHAAGAAFGGAADALRVAGAALDYLNSESVANVDGAACGELLIALGEVQAKLTAAHAGFLRRFDAANAHDADGYGSTSTWLAAKAGMSKKAARASVRQMRQLGDRPLLGTALAGGDITDSLAFTIADWTRKLPAEMREETAAGSSPSTPTAPPKPAAPTAGRSCTATRHPPKTPPEAEAVNERGARSARSGSETGAVRAGWWSGLRTGR